MLLTYFIYYIALVKTLKVMRRWISQKKKNWVRLVTLLQIRVDSTRCPRPGGQANLSDIDVIYLI